MEEVCFTKYLSYTSSLPILTPSSVVGGCKLQYAHFTGETSRLHIAKELAQGLQLLGQGYG